MRKGFFLAALLAALSLLPAAAQGGGTKGEGKQIVVMAPETQGGAEKALSALLQDALTTNLVNYTKMTVTDGRRYAEMRARASRAQYLGGGGAEEGAYVLSGTVQKAGSSYALSFRVTSGEQGVMLAAVWGSYSASDIESGRAAGDLTVKLLPPLGIALGEAEKAALLPPQDAPRTARAGADAQGSRSSGDVPFVIQGETLIKPDGGDEILSLINGEAFTGSIAERAAYYKKMQERWENIFTKLKAYLAREVPVFVYDFSAMKDDINVRDSTVTLTFTPGIKVVPRRRALVVWKSVMDAWQELLADKENDIWTKAVKVPYISRASTQTRYDLSYHFSLGCKLYADDGTVLSEVPCRVEVFIPYYRGGKYGYDVKGQGRYFDEAAYGKVTFRNIPVKDLGEKLSVKIVSVAGDDGKPVAAGSRRWEDVEGVTVLSPDEWAAFAAQ